MGSRIQAAFAPTGSPPARHRLIAYIMAGDFPADGSLKAQARQCQAWVEAGVDILEIGVPFSDPMADGPVIQRAHMRALARGARSSDALSLAAEIRSLGCQAPIVLMSYLNPLLQYGIERSIEGLASSAIDGLLLVDCPGSEDPGLYQSLHQASIDTIALVAPNTDDERLERLLRDARGFVYVLALKGVTGARLSDYSAITGILAKVRARTPLPIAVGFGIREPAQLSQLPQEADAVVVGSALVELAARGAGGAGDPALELIRAFAETAR